MMAATAHLRVRRTALIGLLLGVCLHVSAVAADDWVSVI